MVSLRFQGMSETILIALNVVVHFGDGEKFILSTDGTIMKREVEKFEGKDGFEG